MKKSKKYFILVISVVATVTMIFSQGGGYLSQKLMVENNIRDRVYSIELNSLRVDVWTMTGGGFTTREMFPIGLCKFVEINNFLSYIESLK